jgi:Karyopherin (importin) alpha
VSSGTDKHTKYLTEKGVINKLFSVINNPNLKIKQEIFYIFSNIFACDELIEELMLSPCMTIIVENMTNSNVNLKKEALIAMCNATYTKSFSLLMKLLQFNILPGIIKGLDENDPKLLMSLVIGLKNIVKSVKTLCQSDKWNELLSNFEENDGISKLEDLQYNSNEKIRSESSKLLQELLETDDSKLLSPIGISVFSFV